MSARRNLLAIGGAALVTLLLPLLLLREGAAPVRAPDAPPPKPLAATPQPPLAAVYQRELFAPAAAEGTETAPADAPALIGIVGRLNQDAVAMVRTADGSTRTLKVGESVDGWRLGSLAIDAAFFERGSERARVALPAGDEAPQ